MRDVQGKVLTVNDRVVYAVSNGSTGGLRLARIVELNNKTERVKVEIEGRLEEWQNRTFSTPYHRNKFCVIDTPEVV